MAPSADSMLQGDLVNTFGKLVEKLFNDPRFADGTSPKLQNIDWDVVNHYQKRISGPSLQAGSKILIDRMHTHPDGYVDSTDKRLIASLEQQLGNLDSKDPGRQRIEKLLSYWYGANSLKRLDRFLDFRQPPLLGLPTFTGANVAGPPMNPLSCPDFLSEWQFRRLLIRCLHFPGLLTLNEDPNSKNTFSFDRAYYFTELYRASRMLLELEHLKVRARYPVEFLPLENDPRRSDLNWIRTSRAIIDAAIEQMFDATTEPVGPVVAMAKSAEDAQTPMDEDDIFIANLTQAPLPLMKKIQDQMDETMRQRPFERLLLDLLDKENTFESLLSVEHMDDKLISKQISILDEDNVVRGRYLVDQLDEAIFEKRTLETTIAKILHDIAFVNRQRRNYLLFKDWSSGHRPWRQMYQFYDSSKPGGAWLKDVIKKFRERTYFDQNDGESTNPTDYFVVAPKLFNLEPRDLANQSLAACQLCQLPFYGFPGPSNPPLPPSWQPQPKHNAYYDPDSPLAYTVTQLFCGHLYHTTCIFKVWDRPGAYTQSCNKCGAMAKLNWDLAALSPLEYPPPSDPIDPNSGTRNIFAHNTFDHRRAELLFSKTPGVESNIPMANNRLPFERRDDPVKDAFVAAMYNIPTTLGRLGAPASVGNSGTAFLDKIAVEYWERENALTLAYAHPTVEWRARVFEAGERATIPRDAFAGGPQRFASIIPVADDDFGVAYNPAGLVRNQDHIALGREIGGRYMASIENAANPSDPNYRSVYDYSERRRLPDSRMAPEVEAAELRRRRRARIRKRTAELQAEGKGMMGQRQVLY